MRIAVTGANGMLGSDVVRLLGVRGHDVRAMSRPDFDIYDREQIDAMVAAADVVVNCAAWTAVDDAEAQESSAFELNAVVPQLLARATRERASALVHISTDYVFDGAASEPYDEDAALAPRSAYGRTKAAGEWAVRASNPRHWLLRTAWLYGAGGGCFPKTIARLAENRDEVQVVVDQVGQPTWTVDVADKIVSLLDRGAPFGTYHATSSGSASWRDMAERVVAASGGRARVMPTTTDRFPRPAPRPAWSVLGHRRWHEVGIAPIGDWRDRWEEAADSVLGSGSPSLE